MLKMSLLSSLISNVMGQTVSDPKAGSEAANGSQSQASSMNSNTKSQNDSQTNSISHHEPLEWKFIDFTKAKRSPIFDVDPMILKKFIGHNVTVLSKSRQEFNGCCLAIDPVSLSVILAKRVDGGKIRVITVPGYFLATIKVNSNSVPAENSVSVNDLDVAELYHAPSLYSEDKNDKAKKVDNCERGDNSQETRLAPKGDCEDHINSSSSENNTIKYDQDEIVRRKEKLLDLLVKHRMPVTVRGEVLEIPGGVKIKPPYTIEFCEANNPIVKRKLGELINSL